MGALISKTKPIGSGSDPESGRQTDMVDGVWSRDGEVGIWRRN